MLVTPNAGINGTFMARTYAQLIRHIDTLKHQARELKEAETSGVIARIKEAMKFYGLTAQDLGLSAADHIAQAARPFSTTASAASRQAAAAAAKRPRARRGKSAKQPSTIRFQDDQGNRWSGMGRKPGWLVAGLSAGKSLDDFAVKAGAPAAPAANGSTPT